MFHFKPTVIAFVLGTLLVSLASQAHHSVVGRYDFNKKMTLKGVITKVDWVNPHIRIYLDVTEDDGSITKWNLTGLTPGFMRQIGLKKKDVLGDGSPVEIHGIHSRDDSINDLWVFRITYEDGHFYQMSDPDVKI